MGLESTEAHRGVIQRSLRAVTGTHRLYKGSWRLFRMSTRYMDGFKVTEGRLGAIQGGLRLTKGF